MNTPLKIAAAVSVLCAGLAACEKPIEAPMDKGICWHAIPQQDKTVKFNRLAANIENLETCAATLEGMRLRFMGLGSTNSEIMGAYQGNFIFLQREGVLVGRTLTSARYVALVRTGDGRLAIPGAVSQAAQQALPPIDAPPVTAPAK